MSENRDVPDVNSHDENARAWQDLPAYALGILDAEAAQNVEHLVAHDARAAAELQRLRKITIAVALTAPARIPPSHLENALRERIRSASSSTSNISLVTSTAITAAARQRRSAIRLPSSIYAVAAAVLLIVIGISAIALWTRTPDAEALYRRISADAAEGAATRVALVPFLSPDIEGEVVFSADGQAAVVRVANLPPLSPDQAYQIWFVDENGLVSGGVYALSSETNYIQLPLNAPITSYTRMGASLEAASGSPFPDRPTGPRVFVIPLDGSPIPP